MIDYRVSYYTPEDLITTNNRNAYLATVNAKNGDTKISFYLLQLKSLASPLAYILSFTPNNQHKMDNKYMKNYKNIVYVQSDEKQLI